LNKVNTVVPYKGSDESKKEQVAKMFNNIASHYDFLNRLLSMRVDRQWRKKAVALLARNHPKRILDIATGTGEFALALTKLKPERIVGIDISIGMLSHGMEKVQRLGLSSLVEMQVGDSENMRFADGTFDAATVAFGVRNFENLGQGLREMHRVIKPNGTALVLEFSKPESGSVNTFYNFYFNRVLPFWGSLVSKDDSAYQYLPESVQAFPSGKAFVAELEKAGFHSCQALPLSFGIATIYMGRK